MFLLTEETLKTLLRQQRTKIDEIKQKTNYYNTRNLLERYDESPSAGGGPDPNSPLRHHSVPGALSQGPQAPVTPQRPGNPSNARGPANPQVQTQQTPMSSSLQNHLAGKHIYRYPAPTICLVLIFPLGTPQPIQPLRKQWYDKLADALLGDDESPVSAAASRYALICEKCFNHNGLVKESMWEDARMCSYSLRFSSLTSSTDSARIRMSKMRPLQCICPRQEEWIRFKSVIPSFSLSLVPYCQYRTRPSEQRISICATGWCISRRVKITWKAH